MDKKPLVRVNILAVALLTLGSSYTVVGDQFVESRGIPESISQMQNGPGYINWTVNGTMGENGWYISPLILTCTYDHDWWEYIYYNIGNGTTEYTGPLILPKQGIVFFGYWAVDYEGNSEEGFLGPFKIDYTPPVFSNLTVEKIGFMKWCFSAFVTDELSGIWNVEFYLDGQFLGNTPAEPFEYVWTGSGNHTVCAIAYDAAGNNENSSKNTPFELNHNEIPVEGSLLDNVPIECHGIYPIDIPLSLLNLPVYYTRIEFTNDNDVSIHVMEDIKLETRAGKILFEYSLVQPYPIEPHNDIQTQMFTRYTWHDKFHYRFGFFDITLGFHIEEDDSYVKLVFHGLVFGIGAVIFNPKGEVKESNQECYNFPGLR